jgi:hypothetical protein
MRVWDSIPAPNHSRQPLIYRTEHFLKDHYPKYLNISELFHVQNIDCFEVVYCEVEAKRCALKKIPSREFSLDFVVDRVD